MIPRDFGPKLRAKTSGGGQVAGTPPAQHAEARQGATAHTIAAIPRAVLEQTRDFLRPHGFVIDTCTVRDAPAGMDHAPVFPLDPPAAATRRAMPPRAGLAAAGAGLLLGGGLLEIGRAHV